MLKISAWLTLALCSAHFCHAQRQFKEGYLLWHGDTLRGTLSFNTQSPEKVYYRNQYGAPPDLYDADDAKGFNIDGVDYISGLAQFCDFTVDQDKRVVKHMEYRREFLKPLVVGRRLSLYKLTGFDRYYVRIGEKFEELCDVYFDENDVARQLDMERYHPGELGEYLIYDYKNVLGQFIKRTDSLWPYLDQMSFSEDALRRIVIMINGGVLEYNAPPERVERWWSLFAGLSSFVAQVNIPGSNYVPSVSGHTQVLPAFTVGVRLRQRDPAAPFSGNISLAYSAVNSQYRGKADTIKQIYFPYRLQVLAARFVADYRVLDLGPKSGVSLGLMAGYRWCWLKGGALSGKTPTGGEFTSYGSEELSGGMFYGVHAQCLLNRWEIAAFVQLARDKMDDDPLARYNVNFHNTGLGLFYHF